MIIRDDNLGAIHLTQQIGRHQFTAAVVAIGIVGLENPQTVLDRETGGDHDKPASKPLAGRSADRVDGLPGNQHGHDRSLAGTGGKLQREAHEFGIGVVVGVCQMLDKALARFANLRSNLRQPDRGLDCLDLAKERPDAAKRVMAPVLQQSRRLWSDSPIIGIRYTSPLVDVVAHRIDDCGVVVLLLGRGQPLAFVEYDRRLRRGGGALPRLWYRSNEFGAAALINDLLCGLPLRIEFPVPGRMGIRRVQYWSLKETVIHESSQSRSLVKIRNTVLNARANNARTSRQSCQTRLKHRR